MVERRPDGAARAVVTGLGVISAVGVGMRENWRRLLAGEGGVERISHFDATPFASQVAAEVHGFDPQNYMERKDARRMDRFAQLAVAAAREALAWAQFAITPANAERVGVIVGSAVAGYASMGALSTRNEDPHHASRPFDRERDGFVLGEGAGILLLERADHALARGAPILAEVAGYGASTDAHHIVEPAPGGAGAARAMCLALRSAGLEPADVGYLNAHGTSTPTNDRLETAAIKAVFGAQAAHLAVSSTKGATGHTLGAGGAIQAAHAVMAPHTRVLPPTINYCTPDPACDLDYLPNVARDVRALDAVMSVSLGFGGHNASLVFTPSGEARW